MKTLLRIIILILFCTFTVYPQSQNFIHYKIENGLSASQVFALNQDPNGSLLIGTEGGGINLFDGNNFDQINIEDGIISNSIYSFYIDSTKSLYGTVNGLTVYDGINYKNYDHKNGLPSNSIWEISKDNENNYWLATTGGLCRFDGKKFTYPIKELESTAVFYIHNYKSKMFIATNEGFYLYEKGKKLKHYTKKDGLNNNIVNCFDNDDMGNIWIGTKNGLNQYDIKADKITSPKRFNKFNKQKILSILFDNGKLWLGTDYGFIKYNYRSKELNHFTKKNGLIDNTVWTIFKDRAGNIWLGTDMGIDLILDNGFEIYDSHEAIKNIWNINKIDDDLLIATEKMGIQKFNNGQIDAYFKNPYRNRTFWKILKDSRDNTWFGYSIGVLKEDPSGKLTHFKRNEGFTNDEIMYIYEDSKNRIWFGTFWEGAYYLEDGKFHNLDNDDGLINNSIYSIVEDNDGNIWFSTENGVSKYDGKNFENFISKKEVNGYAVISSVKDYKGNIWFGTFGNGIVKLEVNDTSEIFTKISTNEGLNNNSVLFLEIDDKNSLYVGTNNGLNILPLEDYYKKNKPLIIAYSRHDGIPSYECNQNASYFDKETNYLWYGTINGLVRKDLNRTKNKSHLPKLYFSDLKIFYEKPDSSIYSQNNLVFPAKNGSIELDHDQNFLTFNFKGINLIDYNNIYFKHKLDGLESKWSPKTKETALTYRNLSPGNYTLTVRGYNRLLGDKFSEIKYSITIKDPFWNTLYFKIFSVLIIGFALYLYTNTKVKNARKRSIELEERLQEKADYEEKIEQSQSALNQIIETVPIGIILTDKDGDIKRINQFALELLNYSSIDEIKSSFRNFNSILMDRADQSITSQDLRLVEYQIKTRTNKTIPVLLSNIRFMLNNENVCLIALVDNSAQKEVQSELLKAKEKAENADKLKTEFLAQMSHEIRTPINFILSNISLIEMETRETLDEEMKSCFDSINIGSNRLIRTIDLILNMSELETGSFEPNFEVFDIYVSLRTLLYEFRESIVQKGLKFTFNVESKNTTVRADNYTIVQILSNLIDNAVKYTYKGEIEINVRDTEAGKIAVSIKDTGIGIAKEYIPHLFSKFSQEEQGYSRRFEGNGLGLALVKQYCEINKAEIEVQSEKNVGSTFTIYLNKPEI